MCMCCVRCCTLYIKDYSTMGCLCDPLCPHLMLDFWCWDVPNCNGGSSINKETTSSPICRTDIRNCKQLTNTNFEHILLIFSWHVCLLDKLIMLAWLDSNPKPFDCTSWSIFTWPRLQPNRHSPMITYINTT